MTEFEEKVYAVAFRTPRGKTLSYKEVARRAGRPRAYRAVGNILNRNKNPSVPCHRVIRADGSLGGFNRGSRAKRKLLHKEGVVC